MVISDTGVDKTTTVGETVYCITAGSNPANVRMMVSMSGSPVKRLSRASMISLERHVDGEVRGVRELESVDEVGDGRLERGAVGKLVRRKLELGVVLERERWPCGCGRCEKSEEDNSQEKGEASAGHDVLSGILYTRSI